MSEEPRLSRRSALKMVGGAGATVLAVGHTDGATLSFTSEPPPQTTDVRRQLFSKVWHTPFIDTHEHLCDEHDRLPGGSSTGPDDWTVLLSGYLGSDLQSAGMPADAQGKLYASGLSPNEK